MKKFLFFCFLLVLSCWTAQAQDRVITGKVTSSDDGSPIPGVSIAVKGTTTGTNTATDGTFRLRISNDAVLVFTSIGFDPQTIEVGNTQTTLEVHLKPSVSALSEVVVTALGVSREKKSLGYASQEIKGELVNTAKEGNFINSLSGKVSGVEIKRNNNLGASSNIVVRGFKSLTGNNQALFVVDGVPIDNSNSSTNDAATGRGGYDYGNVASDINPDDIESINVLKGAASTALYGSRAANGVIMITTKKGRKNQGLGVSMSVGYSVGSPDQSTLPKYQNNYGGGYGLYYEDPTSRFLYRDLNDLFPDMASDGKKHLVVPTSEDASWGAKFDPNLQVYDWRSFDPTSSHYQKTSPWTAAANVPTKFLQDATTFNGTVGIDGGGENGSFRVSYTRFDQTGILPNSRLQKNNFSFSGTHDFNKKLSVSTNINFTRQDAKGRYSNGYSDNLMTSFRQWYQRNVDIVDLKNAFERTGQNITWNWADPTDLKPIYWNNPYWQRYNDYETDWRNRLFGNVALTYKITDDINVMGRVTMDTYNELQEERVAVGSIVNNGTAQYARFNRDFREMNYDLFVNYSKNITEDFNIKAMLGNNIRRTDVNTMRAATVGGLVVPGIYALSNSASPMSAPTETAVALYQQGVFGSVSLGYKNTYYLDLTARRDVSSTLPVANNTYFYPSASLSYIFSNHLSDKIPALSFGKLRVNYAEVGNTAPAFSLKNTYVKPTNLNADNRDAFGGQTLFAVSSTLNNPNLRPERTRSAEIGLEMKFLKNRIGFDLTAYRTMSVDQIMPVAVSKATGYDTKYVNAGTIQNKGIELSAFGTPVETKDFSWRVLVNFTRNRNEVVSLYGDTPNLQLASFGGGVTLNATRGQAYGVLQGTAIKLNDNGQKLVATTGYYTQTDATSIIGNVTPKWKMGVSNTLNYKSFSFSFLIDIQHGGSIFSLDRYYGLATGLYKETDILNDKGVSVRAPISQGGGWVFDGVQEDGSANTVRVSGENYGVFGYRRNPASVFVYDAGYVKLREVTLSYKLPATILGNTRFFKSASISVVGRNLWIIHKNLPYADPEDGLTSGNLSGWQSGAYPSLREIGGSLRFSF
ncbi:SusC/RagA family TonB-linked outer membrane protein [Siphonobacter aquaeclarae]|uniref:TonB-linked outer membrane protein, SusC/RagA family n=1 Tax=Siphonobacter aquaeclarae TaxID=563176 RepID=A0A1G9MI97_9BACT|nr:SusC/RagA family TonB-linked outer membrane protein [Siphonobacter aquaeclarae]SDL73627.1 TonB-linked outer membrane protein, SusC/RagA family [Siphonobacter aquaeclarae]